MFGFVFQFWYCNEQGEGGGSKTCSKLYTKRATASSLPPLPPPPPPTPNLFKLPLFKVGLTVVNLSIFAVYEMTQPLEFLNSIGFIAQP